MRNDLKGDIAMLNPKLIEKYHGEDRCKFLNDLAVALGPEMASEIYVLKGMEEEYKGSIVPKYVKVKNELVDDVSMAIFNYVMNNTDEDVDVWIHVFGNDEIDDEEGVQLCLT